MRAQQPAEGEHEDRGDGRYGHQRGIAVDDDVAEPVAGDPRRCGQRGGKAETAL